MNLRTWILFVVTEAVLCLTPGPAVLLVVSAGLRDGVRSGVSSTLGILAANAVYYAISATSLGAVLAASTRLYVAVKWAGSAYLVYLGLCDLLRPAPILGGGKDGSGQTKHRRAFSNGFLLQAANPKAIIFFVALLPQFLDRSYSIPLQVLILGITSMVVEFVILLGYSGLAGKASSLVREPRYALLTHRIGGGMLILAGAGLALLTR